MRLTQLIQATILGAALALPAITPAAFAQSTPATTPMTTPMTGTKPATAAANAPKTATAAVKPIGAPVNVNTASIEELKALPGIGKSRSKAIVAGRPYTSVDQVDTKKIIPHSVFDKIKGQLTI